MKAAEGALRRQADPYDRFGIVVLYTVLGPPIGGLIPTAFLFDGFKSLGSGFDLLIGMTFFGYLFGGIPAALTGLISAFLPGSLRGRRWFLMTTTAVGAAITLVPALALSLPSFSWPTLSFWLLYPLAGGLAAFVCGALTLWIWRPPAKASVPCESMSQSQG